MKIYGYCRFEGKNVSYFYELVRRGDFLYWSYYGLIFNDELDKITYLKFKLPDDFQTRPYDPTPYGDNMVRPFQEGDVDL